MMFFTAPQSTFTAHMIMMSVDLQCSVDRIGWDVDNKEEFQTILVLLMLVTNVDGVNDVGVGGVGVGVGVVDDGDKCGLGDD